MYVNYLGYNLAVDLVDYERMKAKRIKQFDENCAKMIAQAEQRLASLP